jgi:hypothetical protein
MTKAKSGNSYDVHSISKCRVDSLSVTVGHTNKQHVRFGLSDNEESDEATFQMGAFPNGRIYIKNGGAGTVGEYDDTTLMEVKIEGENVVAYVDGTAVYTYGEKPAAGLFAKVSPYESGANVAHVALGACSEGSEMTEIGTGSCAPTSAVSVIRTETKPDLDGCKATCIGEADCSYVTYDTSAKLCSLLQGIPCELMEEAGSVTYGKPTWFFEYK